ncbi:MAG TPA: branched-chain amino acid ABC transporter ATP-binding protein/permease [Rhodanobacter sp.]
MNPANAQSAVRRGLPEVLVLVGLVLAPFLLPYLGFSPGLMTRILIWGLFGIGFDLLFGYTGLLSFGQAAFYGTGGFMTAYLLTNGIANILVALLAGAAAAAVAGVIIGYLTLRRSGIYFAMSTLAFGEMFFFLENSVLGKFTGGENGIAGVPSPEISLGFTNIEISSGMPMYWFVAVFFFVGYLIARRIVRSPFGAVLRAIRGNPKRAIALGHATQHYKLTVFVIAAVYAGVAGGLLGVFQGYMPPDAFAIDTSAQLIIQTVMGGVATLLGPLLGAAIWLYIFNVVQGIAGIGAYWKLILGVIFVIVVTVFRFGVGGALVRLFSRRRAQPTAPVTGVAGARAEGAGEIAELDVVPAVASDTRPVLEARGVTKQYGGLTAVNNVNFSLTEGELHVLIGPNGAGKSTFFAMLTGELPTTSGQVFFRGHEITGIGVTAVCQLGMSKSYQINQLFERLTVRQNVTVPVLARQRGRFKLDMLRGTHHLREVDAQVEAAIELVGLSHCIDSPVAELAYGEKRRLEIGLALATGANVLLFDEPLAGLGPEERVLVVKLLKSIHKNRSIVVVGHDMDAMFQLAERITVLHEGRTLISGTPDEIRASKEVQTAYLGGVDA